MPTKRLIIAVKASLTVLIFSSIFHISQSYADLSVGDSYGGGTVFCVSQTADIKNCVTQGSGKYGLIMANEDQVNFDSNAKHGVTWSKEYRETGALSYDDGLANTRAIIAAHPQDNPSNNAAWLIQEYNKAHGQDANANLTVWYLPAKNELNKMYLYAQANGLIGKGCVGRKANGIQCFIGGHGTEENGTSKYKIYWSSTEYSGGSYFRAWSQHFDGGVQRDYRKDGGWLGVRAVRAFNNLTIQPFTHLPQPKIPQPLGIEVPAVSPEADSPTASLEAAVAQIHLQAPVYQSPVAPLQHAPQAAVPTATPITPPVAAPAAAAAPSPSTTIGADLLAQLQHASQADLSVGDSYGGGTVFCVSQTPDIKNCVTQGSGKYGLIMANEDQVNFDSNAKHGITWATEYETTGALSDDDGLANTRAIIAVHPQDNPSNNAAWLIQEYNKAHGQDANDNLTVWYLPAKNELNKMYLYAQANGLIGKGCAGRKANGIQCLIGGCGIEENGTSKYKIYWSSTEYSGANAYAWTQYFSEGSRSNNFKDGYWFGARAVRAFNNLTIQPFTYLPKPKSPQAIGLEVPIVPPEAASSAAPQGAAVAQIQLQDPVAQLQHVQRLLTARADLSAINLANCHLGVEGIRQIFEQVNADELTTLDLTDNNIGDEGATFLAEVLRNNRTLTVLYLGNNNITNEGAIILVNALRNHPHLTALHLGGNRIDADGARALVETLHCNPVLATIHLIGNQGARTPEIDEYLLTVIMDVDPALARWFAIRPDTDVATRLFLARDAHTNETGLRFMLWQRTADALLLDAIARNPSANPGILNTVAIHPLTNTAALLAIAQNPISNTEDLQRVLARENIDVPILIAIGNHKNASAELLLNIVRHKLSGMAVLTAVIHNPNITAAVLAVVATHKNATVELLSNVIKHELCDAATLTAVVRNPNVNVEIFTETLDRHLSLLNADALLAIAQNPHTNPEGLTKIFTHERLNVQILIELAKHRNATAELLMNIVGHRLTDTATLNAVINNHNVDAVVLAAIAGHPMANASILQDIARFPSANIEIMRNVVGNSNVTADILTFVALHGPVDSDLLFRIVKKSNDAATLLAVAQNPRANLVTLKAILCAKNLNIPVLAALANHHEADDELLGDVTGDKLIAGLRGDDIRAILTAVIHHRNFGISALRAVVNLHLGNVSLSAEELLIMANNRGADKEILKVLMNNRDVNRDVLAAIARHPNASEGLLYGVVRNVRSDNEVFLAVIGNPNVGGPELDYIVQRADITVPVLAAIVANSAVDARVLRAIVRHRHVNREILNNIMRHPNVNDKVLIAIGERHELLDENLVDALRERRRELLTRRNYTNPQMGGSMLVPAAAPAPAVINLTHSMPMLQPPPPYSE